MAYVKKIWKDYPDTTTPILASDMSNIENGIEAVDTALENLENNVNNIEDGLETVTNNVNNGWYQTGLSPTFTKVSWDSSVRTGVVNSNLDLTPYLSVGMKVKFTQNSAIKYAFITAITSTQLTLFLGTDYSLNDYAISNSYYSMLKAPFGFPLNPDKWAIAHQINTTANLNKTGFSTIDTALLPVGLWKLSCKIMFGQTLTSQVNCYIGWSKSQTSFTNSKYRLFGTVKFSGNNYDILTAPIVMFDVVSKENWYWILQIEYGTPTNIQNTATVVPSLYIFECAYL